MAELRIGHYVLGERLGLGSFGKVKLAKHQLTGHEVAVKIINRKKMRKKDAVGKVRREIQYLKLFRHPHIIKLYQVISTPTDIFMVMEYISGGELFEYIINHGKLAEHEARRFFQQIISGVDYCHRHFVVHRDLKPENLLLDSRGNVKIADFGLSNMMTDGECLHTSCGSPNYAAPEVIEAKHYAGPQVDIWSCGVILYALLNGSLPFHDPNYSILFKKIRNGVFAIPDTMPSAAADLVVKMLVVDPQKRATMAVIRSHEWFVADLAPYLFPDPSHQESSSVDLELVREIAERFKVKREEVLSALQGQEVGHQLAIAYQLIMDNRRLVRQQAEVSMSTSGVFSTSPSSSFWGSFLHGESVSSSLRPHHLPARNFRSAMSRFMQSSTNKRQRWHLGVRCSARSSAASIMREVYQAMLQLDFEWKTVSPYNIICQQRNPVSHRYVRMNLQLYRVDGAYLVDFRSLPTVMPPRPVVTDGRRSSTPDRQNSLYNRGTPSPFRVTGTREERDSTHNTMEFFGMCAALVTALLVR